MPKSMTTATAATTTTQDAAFPIEGAKELLLLNDLVQNVARIANYSSHIMDLLSCIDEDREDIEDTLMQAYPEIKPLIKAISKFDKFFSDKFIGECDEACIAVQDILKEKKRGISKAAKQASKAASAKGKATKAATKNKVVKKGAKKAK